MKGNSISCNHVFIHSQFIRFFFLLLVILFFNYCTEEKPTEQTEVKSKIGLSKTNSSAKINFSVTSDSTKKDSTKTKDKDKDTTKNKDGTIIEPYAQSSCQKDVDYWVLEKYVPVPGKTIGIWPNDWSYYWVDKYRNYYGFAEFFILHWRNGSNETTLQDLQTAYDVGYSNSNIMFGTGGAIFSINEEARFKSFAYYYVDEPIEQGRLTSSQLNDAAIFINSINPQAKFKVGTSYGKYAITSNDDAYKTFVGNFNFTDILFTAYEGGIFQNVCDQSEHWTYFRDFYGGSKVVSQWIHIDRDYDGPPAYHCDIEYRTLFSSANALGLNKIWLFANGSSHFERLETFCVDAFLTGWLNRFERKWVYTYKCINQNPCDCDPYTLGGEWILVSKYKTWETRTVSH